MVTVNPRFNSLGLAQAEYETSAQQLKKAQNAFMKAADNLKVAEERYTSAAQGLNVAMVEVRTKNKVLPVGV